MKLLLIATAVIEVGAGVALLGSPSATVALLLGTPLETSAALTLGRLAGAALLALGVACWLARDDAPSRAARGLISAMVLYNLGAVILLGNAGMQSSSGGIAPWLAAGLHTAMTAWCVTCLWQRRRNS